MALTELWRVFKKYTKKTSSFGVGAWLFIVYGLLLYIVVGTLSAYHFQSAVASQSDVNTTKSIMEIDFISKDLMQLKDNISQKTQEVQSIDKNLKKKWEENLKQKLNGSSEPAIETKESIYSLYKEEANSRKNFLLAETEQLSETLQFRLATDTNPPELAAELLLLNEIGFGLISIMPNMILTLVLTLAMGGLGSLIYVTYDFFHLKYGTHDEDGNRKHTITWYIFRPLLGMVTALAVFVLIKAGHLSLSVPADSSSAAQAMSPFFISFLGIISGLMTEQATNSIRKAGHRLFRSDAQKDADRHRWAVHVQETMTKQKVEALNMLPYLGVQKNVLDKWLNQEKPVPPDAQKVIAALLKTSARILFTDIKPDDALS